MMRDNADRFEGLAETYAHHRPGYPAEAFADIVAACRSDRRIAVDVGAGPGTSTRALRAELPDDWLVIAIEPGRDMRRVLGRSFGGNPGVQVIDASAEELPLSTRSAGLVVACSSLHWFDRTAFFAEATRVLAPGGVLGLVRNRLVSSPIVEAFDTYIEERCIDRHGLGAQQTRREPTVRALAALPGFGSARSRTYRWELQMDTRALIDLYLTRATLWSVVRRTGLGRVMDDLTLIAAGFGPGPWKIGYETTVKRVRRV